MCIPDISGKLTPLGNVVVESHRDTGHVSVRLRPRNGVNLRHNLTESDGEILLDMWSGRKTPALHDEATIGGKTGERMRWE